MARRTNLASLLVLLAALLAFGTPPPGVALAWTASSARPSVIGGDTTLPAAAHLTGYPLLYQQHPLSCEAAAVSMATRGTISEAKILAQMAHDPNPWRGFRGNVDGGQSLGNGLANYGIYAPPLAVELHGFGYQTVVITGTAAPALLRYSIGILRRPAVVWVTHHLGYWTGITGHVGSQSFSLIDGEHARLAIGYDARGIYSLDPLDGPRYDPWPSFLRSWTRFDQMALIVAPTLPHPAAPLIRAHLVGATLTWSWNVAARPLASDIEVFRQGRPSAHLIETTGTGTAIPLDAPPPAKAITGTLALSGTVESPDALADLTGAAVAAESLLMRPWRAGPITLLRSIEPGVPYTLTVRYVDPLGLTSPVALTPIIIRVPSGPPHTGAVPTPPPPMPVSVRATIAGPGTIRWTWPPRTGRTYRVASYRYLGSRPIDYLELAVGHSGSYARTALAGRTYYAQVLAIDNAGRSSAPTVPIAAPVIMQARLLGPIAADLRHGGYGAWHWSARGATAYLIRSYAYAGSRVMRAQRLISSTPSFRRKLIPGLDYHLQILPIGNDGTPGSPVDARMGLVYHPAHAVQGLRVAMQASGMQRWTWAAQPGVTYRLQLIRYAGSHATLVAHLETQRAEWVDAPAPADTTDYLQVRAVDGCGDVGPPAQRRGLSSSVGAAELP